MLPGVAFVYVEVALRGREFRKKKAAFPFSLLLPMLKFVFRHGLCGCRRQTEPSDIVIQHGCGCGLCLDSCGCTRRTALYNFFYVDSLG